MSVPFVLLKGEHAAAQKTERDISGCVLQGGHGWSGIGSLRLQAVHEEVLWDINRRLK